MPRHTFWRTLAVAILLSVSFVSVPAPQASAANQQIAGDRLRTNFWQEYTTARTVSQAPWGIAFLKSTGPEFRISHYECINPSNTSPYDPVAIVNQYVFTRPNNVSPFSIQFCMRANRISGGGTNFSGFLDWDGTS